MTIEIIVFCSCNEHFTQSVLFDNLRYLKSDWNLLDEDLLTEYLPKNEESCDVSRIRVNDFENVSGVEHRFKKFELFEVEQQKGGKLKECSLLVKYNEYFFRYNNDILWWTNFCNGVASYTAYSVTLYSGTCGCSWK